ncbi:hypothetical protein EIP91_003696 [Steccherinum ochraceum]|uniref:CP-type G domain-containing protein n=1 Tax=Steccherinum ochraceum TaxID=92696 RepID=A0A4R0RUQ4_9APHY|nr:hypothetical protein EIP91_003696 [Steccherinum ochraceum]
MGRNKSQKLSVPGKSKLKKDPGVPRLPSLKVRNAGKEKLHASPPMRSQDPDSVMASEPTLSSLAALAAAASTPDEISDPSSSTQGQGRDKFQTKEQMRRHYIKTLHRVIDESDVILLVLDSRDPEGCRSRLVEEEVRRRENEGKRLVFVLNKVDLIPASNAQAWLRYLRHSTPTLPFRSVSSSNSNNISTATSPALVKLLKAYRPSGKQSITVGVVGYPNVGKSSLVNALKRVKVCAVAAQPGHTTTLQTVHLERGVRIVDSPGVIFDDDNDENSKDGGARGSLKLRNVMKVEDAEDPIEIVEEILARVPSETILKLYNLPQTEAGQTPFGTTLEFLTMLALTSGKLLKGGTPDILGCARHVMNDWNHQKIPYYSEPPTIHPSSIPTTVATAQGNVVAPGAENVGQARIINEFGKAFEVDGLFGMADQGAFGGGGSEEMAVEEEEDQGHMDLDEAAVQEEMDISTHSLKRPRSVSPPPEPELSTASAPTSQPPQDSSETSAMQRPPKRFRRMHANDPISDRTLTSMAHSNPLNRRNMKREAKRARRAGRPAPGALHHGGMEVDEGFALSGTFFNQSFAELGTAM